MLTIGQLARYAKVTVRTVRHYHQIGLLAEPERDDSGYRRYGPQDVIDLVRITTLASTGVPLSRIAELLAADPEVFAAGLAEIDAELQARIAELEQRRLDLAQLPSAERLSVPPAVWALLDSLRSWGVSDEIVAGERDTWILIGATYPDFVDEAARVRLQAMTEHPDWRNLTLEYQAASDWSVDDPRLEDLAQRTAQALVDTAPIDVDEDTTKWYADPAAVRLLESYDGHYPESWRWLNRRVGELVGDQQPSGPPLD